MTVRNADDSNPVFSRLSLLPTMPRVALHPSRTNPNNPLLTSGPNAHPSVLKRHQVRPYYILAGEELKTSIALRLVIK